MFLGISLSQITQIRCARLLLRLNPTIVHPSNVFISSVSDAGYNAPTFSMTTSGI